MNDLTAEELARIDSICLAYESDVREGQKPSIDGLVSEFGGEYAELLRQELLGIQDELTAATQARPVREPFSPAPMTTLNEGLAYEPALAKEGDETPIGDMPGGSNVATKAAADFALPMGAPSPPPETVQPPLTSSSSQATSSVDGGSVEQSETAAASSAPAPSKLAVDQVAKHARLLAPELPVSLLETTELSPPMPLVVPALRQPRSHDDHQRLLPREGDMIGPYRIGRTLGQGGMGVVYAATDTRLNRLVAIKVMAIDDRHREELVERFEREAKAVAALSHPNIVELFDVGVSAGLPFAVMEYLDGESLMDRMQRTPLAVNETRRLGAQICDALAVAHRENVIHRDLKPQNVMLIRGNGSESTIVKLVDFGLSRVPREGFGAAGLDQDSGKTRDGVVLGTPGFMAPEQARGELVTPAADIFSLGCLLFEAFYGRPAITGETIADRFASTLSGAPTPDPIRRRDDIALADLIDECLQREPAARPTSAGDLAQRLRSASPLIDPVRANANAGYAVGEMLRRRFMTATAGGLVGAVIGGLASPDHTRELQNVKRLAVLSFGDFAEVRSPSEHGRFVKPVAERDIQLGDKLAALLANELSRLNQVAVAPFRPMIANHPDDYVKLGQDIGVDAFVSGTYRQVTRGTEEFVELYLTIVSAKSGTQLWGNSIVSGASDNLLEQTKLAEEVAAAIGHGLTSTASGSKPPSVQSFSCLVDGKLRADPDSVAGLEMSLQCFERAKKSDESYVEPRTGIALASITLAAQSEPARATELILSARQELAYLERLRGTSILPVEARLAAAMLDWQTLNRYEQAERELNQLAIVAPNHWQVQHQRGLLLLTLGRQQLARQALKEAKLLYPMSAIIKIDHARAEWFSGNSERARNDAKLVLSRIPCRFARGLLIDIYEDQQQYAMAAEIHDNFPIPETRSAYFTERRKRLAEIPYGPFGSLLNEAILDLRSQGRMTDLELAGLAESQSPMLPLLLSAHPAFSATRLLSRAQELLPREISGATF